MLIENYSFSIIDYSKTNKKILFIMRRIIYEIKLILSIECLLTFPEKQNIMNICILNLIGMSVFHKLITDVL